MTSVPAGRPEDGPSRSEEDRRLLIRYHRHGDQAAREQLVQRLLPLARRMARRYRRSDEPLDDLVQVATLGLIKAIDRFDPARETAFSSYAVPTMLGELKRYFRDNGWAVHVPRGMQERVMQVDNAMKDLSRRLGRSPSAAEVGEQLGLTTEQVLEAMEAASAYDAVSLESYRFGDEGDGETYAESIGVEDDRFELVEYGATIAPTLQALPARDRIVLHLRFVEDMTQAEIAERVGVSQMHVSRLIRRALERLRTVAEHSGLAAEPASRAVREKRHCRRSCGRAARPWPQLDERRRRPGAARPPRRRRAPRARGAAEVGVADDRARPPRSTVTRRGPGPNGTVHSRRLSRSAGSMKRSTSAPIRSFLCAGTAAAARSRRAACSLVRRRKTAVRSDISGYLADISGGSTPARADLEPHVGGALAHAPVDRDLVDEVQAPAAVDGRLGRHLDLGPLAVALVDHLALDDALGADRQRQRDRPLGAELHASW